ncbi:MAG: DegV family protein [Coriobacteriales bacterium]|jgi:DegV family protein with EDD domain|nr:DegV family protein [Coriobacteriales bacterium]
MPYTIITDSSANLPDSYVERYGLSILSLEFIVDGVSYRGYTEGEITDNRQFYNMMREGKVVKTSLVSPKEAETVLRACFEAGNDALYLGFDSALSGTYEAVSAHMRTVQESEYPERKLRCVDTLAAALGEGQLVVEAAKRKLAGASLDELADWAEEQRLGFAHWFTVEDLNYLQRGGRLSKGAAFAATLLNIKPVLHVDVEGRLVPVEKVRGRKKSIQALFERYAKTAREPRAELPVYISHGDCLEDAQQLADLISSEYGATDVVINDLDPVIGAHAGPGTVALFFLTDEVR